MSTSFTLSKEQTLSRIQLRNSLRKKRRDLSTPTQCKAALKACFHLARHPWFRCAKHIAFYWPNDGELSPIPLLNLALKMGKHCYLPITLKNQNMIFRQYQQGDKLPKNQYGIPQPQEHKTLLPVQRFDLVLMPLVGFDLKGNRLGMGGGFYDRAFAHARGRQPKRVGLAHSCQQVESIPCAHWDIPLHAIVTDKNLQRI